ncbi:MAG: glycosyltransferase [Bacillaceae bacterium]
MINRVKKIANHFREGGITPTLSKIIRRSLTKYGYKRSSKNNLLRMQNLYKTLSEDVNWSEIKGIAIVTSALEFDEVYNQRTINLAKYLSEKSFLVLYVVWQWEPKEILEKSYQNVFPNVYQMPLYDFYNTLENLDLFEQKNKHFYITFPAGLFKDIEGKLANKNYKIIYDIMDEWEEFQKVGHAPWYKRSLEQQIVKDSNYIFAVSEPLKGKFASLNENIHVVGNGYTPKLSGEDKRFIANKMEETDSKIHVGYFGHLTESWFDWDYVFALAANPKMNIHLVGHGVSSFYMQKIEKHDNIHFYGKVHPSELYKFVSKWHVGIIPFKQSKLSEAVDPIKIYEYLYFGLPTVSTGIPHLSKYPFVKHCDSTDELVVAVQSFYKQVINQGLDYRELDEFLKETTWDERFNLMLKIID